MQQPFVIVEQEYKKHFDDLGDRKFHFASRLFLWAKDEFAKEKLEELRKEYIGNNEKEYEEKIKEILEDKKFPEKVLFGKTREPFFSKYPLLKAYNKILFRNLFCKTVYGIELKSVIEKLVPTEKFLELKKLLENDPQAIALLSTHAVNYFYTLDFYLDSPKNFISPGFFLDIAKKRELFDGNLSLRLYLLTHCVIGETAFYSRKVGRNADIYKHAITSLEKEISDNFENISLDNKFEFLVCARLCGMSSILSKRILLEALASFDQEKKYFIDLENIYRSEKNTLIGAEHRNVLALMAMHLDMKIN